VELIADRFVALSDEEVIDLASGERVLLSTSAAGGPTEQARWAARCDRFAAWCHPRIARLADFGEAAETRRFEAWRCGQAWRGSPSAARRAIDLVSQFLVAQRLTADGLSLSAVYEGDDGPIVVPPPAAGYEAEAVPHGAAIELDALGLAIVARRAVTAIVEMLQEPAGAPTRVAALWGPQHAGLRTAIGELARAARVAGFVPLSASLRRDDVLQMVADRSTFLIASQDAGWIELINRSTSAPRSHILLLTGREEPSHSSGGGLEKLGTTTLIAAVRPVPSDEVMSRRVRDAAARAHGLPGRFARLLSTFATPAPGRSRWRSGVAVSGRVAEGALSVSDGNLAVDPCLRADERRAPTTADPATWPHPGELTALRRRLTAGIVDLDRGRHAIGGRTVRACVAALARRSDWPHATTGALALARSLLRRGHPDEAQAVLSDAARYASEHRDRIGAVDVAILAGIASTDLGRLDQGECVLRAAVAAAEAADAPERLAVSRLALARCLCWSGRYGDAQHVLGPVERSDWPVLAGHAACSASRVALARRDLSAAATYATRALAEADRLGDARLTGRAACVAALVHLHLGDFPAAERDAARALSAARQTKDPLRALKARLLGAEAERRAGRPRRAAVLLRRLGAARLPPLVRARCSLLGDLVSGMAPAVAVARRSAAIALPGLAIYGPTPSVAFGGAWQDTVTDVVDILGFCQTADDDVAVLTEICKRLRRRLRASAVAFYSLDGAVPVVLASDGQAYPDIELVHRVAAAGQPIAPHRVHEVTEAGSPVRYAGDVLGALAAKWTVGMSVDVAPASMLLTMAAAAAGPVCAALAARRRAAPAHDVDELLGVSAAMADVRRAVTRAANAPFCVLVDGESGSGKELVARALHRQSPRRDRPFCALNCAAIPDDLVDAELFGHARGAFTGAVAERAGVFEEAHTGTLFLDEVGELTPRAQAKILRTIQEGELRRVGQNVARRVDVRLVSATNRNLREEVAAGRFRLDLFYRLDVIRITLPPLRDRREDIAVLADHFWSEATSRVGSRATLSGGMIAALARYDWPGNIRELQNVLAALAVRCPRRGLVTPAALPPAFHASVPRPAWRLNEARRVFDKQFVRAALVRTGGHRERAAGELGISRQGLAKLMMRLGIGEERSDAGGAREAPVRPAL
jgi:DNA-binding NtrC family response regulator